MSTDKKEETMSTDRNPRLLPLHCFYCGKKLAAGDPVNELTIGQNKYLAHAECDEYKQRVENENPTWAECEEFAQDHTFVNKYDTYLSDEHVDPYEIWEKTNWNDVLTQRREIACALLVGARINKQMIRMLSQTREAEIKLLGAFDAEGERE